MTGTANSAIRAVQPTLFTATNGSSYNLGTYAASDLPLTRTRNVKPDAGVYVPGVYALSHLHTSTTQVLPEQVNVSRVGAGANITIP